MAQQLAAEAIQMAVEMRHQFAQLASRWKQSGFEVGLGIGLSVGYATVGRVGFEGYYGYAAVGSVMNLAARLCAVALPGQIVSVSLYLPGCRKASSPNRSERSSSKVSVARLTPIR
jgi:adenylate cyclase